jgi:predicted nucleotidyltransferase
MVPARILPLRKPTSPRLCQDIDPRIDERIPDIDDQIERQQQGGVDQYGAEDQGAIAIEHTVDEVAAQAGDGKGLFRSVADVWKLDTIVSDMSTPSVDDLGSVLLGKTRGAVLGLLLSRPDEEFHVRQIARLSGATLGPVQRELKLLAQIGVLKRRESGHQILYCADPTSPIHEELRGLILKTVGIADVLKAAIKPLASKIRVAFVFGSFVTGRQRAASDVDLMIIGDIPVALAAEALAESQRRLGREVNPTIYRPAEFAAKLRGRHHFISAVMAGPKVFLLGDAHELSRVAEERMASASQEQSAGNRRSNGRR